ncbi:cation:proton antiporter [Candidatus Nitrosotenuis cloacae]|uniref:cation:proton antiporter domain-containing protein n=1 Tax=Candidatus Nitrosotenuis cloacae TaxID=1603555 RepID=UPI0022814797|nr:cation:proton antiporter [Candidatus Nitrosotenuis cloacae]
MNFDVGGLELIRQMFSAFQNSASQFNPLIGETMSAPVLLLAGAVIIFLGVAGELFFKKTGIPDIAFLMILGVIIGPILGIIPTSTVIVVVPYFAAIALILIMFDGGLNLDIKTVIKTAHYALLLSVAGFLASIVSVALVAFYGLGWGLVESILLGTIVGGSSSIIVFGLVRRLPVSDQTKSMLSLESAITDILVTIVAFVLIDMLVLGVLDPNLAAISFAKSVAVGLALGFGIGIPWAYVTTKMQNAQHSYMLTIGILFVIFFVEKSLGGTGALAPLIFGLMLGNKQLISRYLKFKVPEISSDDPTHNQLTFLVRSFFFVFVGLLATIGRLEFVIAGVIGAVLIYLTRVGIIKISLRNRFGAFDNKVTAAMIPRGLAAAVVAIIPLTMGLPNAESYPQIVFVIILTSVIITTVALTRAKSLIPRDPDVFEKNY